MRESILRETRIEYEQQRERNHAEEARRLAEASGRDPMIGQLVAERMRLFRDGAREALANPRGAQLISERLTERIAEIQSQLRDRLVAGGYAADYLQPVYQCPLCHDTGFVGEVIRERCECFGRRIQEKQLAQAGHGLNPSETFETFDASVFPDTPLKTGGEDTQRRFMLRLRAMCEKYTAEYPGNERRNMVLFGTSGLGKTFLLNSIGNRLLQRGELVMKVTGYQLSERMRAAVFEDHPERFTSMVETPVLLLDDLGVEPIYNNITMEYLFSLLNERLLAGLHTIISTNLMLDELERRYNERVCSRLFDRRNTVIVQFEGVDVRMG